MASSQKNNYKIIKLFQWIIALIVAVAISFWIKTCLMQEEEEKRNPPSTEQTQTTDLPSVVFFLVISQA